MKRNFGLKWVNGMYTTLMIGKEKFCRYELICNDRGKDVKIIKILTSNRVIVSTSNDKFDEWQSKECFNFLSPLDEENLAS